MRAAAQGGERGESVGPALAAGILLADRLDNQPQPRLGGVERAVEVAAAGNENLMFGIWYSKVLALVPVGGVGVDGVLVQRDAVGLAQIRRDLEVEAPQFLQPVELRPFRLQQLERICLPAFRLTRALDRLLEARGLSLCVEKT